MHYQRALIAIFAVILLLSACGKSGRNHTAPAAPSPGGPTSHVSQAGDYGFGTGGFTPGVDFYTDRFVVGFKGGAKGARAGAGKVDYNPQSKLYQNTDIAALAREIRDAYGVQLDKEAYVRNINFAGYQTKDGSCAKEIMERIQADYADAIDYIEYDSLYNLQYVPNDPDYPANLWGMVKINAASAWDTERGDRNVMVCVIDTGVRYSGNTVSSYPDHEDLADNYMHPPDHWPNETFDLYENDNVPQDAHGHGSHCSGTIGAVGDNSKGVVGVVHAISMVQIRVFPPSGGAPSSRIAAAIVLGTEIGSDVISMSLGGPAPSSATKAACEDAYAQGIFVAVAAANANTSKPYYPGYYEVNCCVGATQESPSDSRAGFSNYGQWVDIAAPGTNTRSCGYTSTSAYMNWSGTSMATPHVAGAAALLLSYDPTLTVDELRAALEGTGADLNDSQWQNNDIKRLDIGAALALVVGDELGDPPSAQILFPEDGGTVSGTATVEVGASDGDGSILKVFFIVDDVIIGTDSTAPYTCLWDTSRYINGSHTLKAVALDNQHLTGSHTITVTVNNSALAPNFLIDFEGGSSGWWSLNEMGPGYWHVVNNLGASGTNSYRFGGAGGANYGNSEFDRLYSPVIDLSGLEAARLKFKHRYAIGAGDALYLLVNDGSYEFVYLDGFGTGTLSSWEQKTYSLNGYIGKSIQIGYFFYSDGSGTAAGYWMDDFAVEKKTPPCSITITAPSDGADVSGVADFTANVTDDVGVSLVGMRINGATMASFGSAGPYEYSWTTTNYHGGYHELSVYTEDEWPTSNTGSIVAYVKNHAITGVNLDTAETGSSITIEGSYFIADGGDSYNPATDKLYFAGVSGWSEAAVSSWTADAITATVPEDAVTGAVVVDINGAQVTSSFDFAVLPRLDALNPPNQVVGGNITLQGTGFGTSATGGCAVHIGSLECGIVSWGNSEIEITVPPGVVQSDVTVTTEAGDSNPVQFTPKPNILSFAPTRTWAGQEVAIGGTSFGAAQGASTVLFTGPVFAGPADIVSWGDSEIVVRVPFGARQGDVVVTVNGIASEGQFLLIVLGPPALNGLGQY